MPAAAAAAITTIPNVHFHYQILAPIRSRSIRIWASIFVIAAGANRAMVTTAASSSSSSCGGAYTTLKERATFEKEIKKSKFIAIAGSISDEQSAFSFLSQVPELSLFYFFFFF